MAISTYTVRVTDTDGVITAWIDKDGSLCIEQPNHPDLLSTGEPWASKAEAKAWADQHAADLTQYSIDAENALAAKAEADALEAAAKQAILDNASKIDEIHAMLKQLTDK